MSWISTGGDRRSIVGELTEIAAPYLALEQSLWHQPHLPAEVLELCRLRLAQLHRCAVELARTGWEIPEEKKAALTHWERSELFTAADRGCLAFTEVYAMDAQALTDDHAAAVKAHFGDAGLVLLVEALGLLDGAMRVSLLWALSPEGEAS